MNLFGLYLTQVDDIAIDIANNSSIVYIMGCQAIESAPSSYGFNVTYSKARIEGCKVLNHRICAKALFSDMVSRDWVDSSGVEYGIVSDMGGKISKIGAQPSGRISPEYTSNGGTIVEPNGTQISDVISSGLSCTWGTIIGGYNRHGNNNAAMVTIQVRITLTQKLIAGTEYTITGFPKPSATAYNLVPVATNLQSTVRNGYLKTNGDIVVTLTQDMQSADALMFNCTYLTIS